MANRGARDYGNADPAPVLVKLTLKVSLALLLVALVPLGGFGWLALEAERTALLREIEKELRLNSDRDRRQVELLVAQFDERLRLVASRTQLRLSLRAFLATGDGGAQAKMNRILGDALQSIASFEEISVTGLEGKIVASTNVEEIGSEIGDEAYFVKGRETVHLDHFSLLEGQLKVYLAGPLTLDGERIGMVAIRASAADLVEVLTSYVGLGETGETLLVRRMDNGDAMFIGPLRFEPDAELRRTVSKDDAEALVVKALGGVREMFPEALDYRGEPVVAVTEFLPVTGWGMVSKIDRREALGPIREATEFLTAMLVVTGAMVGVLAVFTSRRLTRPILKLADAAAHVSAKPDYRLSLVSDAKDEIGHLTASFNRMLETIAQREQELQSSEERFRLAVRATEDGIWDWNVGTNEFYLSEHFEELLGYQPGELKHHYETWRSRVHAEDGQRVAGEIERHLKTREPYESEFRLRTKGGPFRWFRAKGQAHWVLGKPVRMAGSLTDITERKVDEETIRRALREKETMLQEIHHRVKNNMQVICSLLQLQSEEVADEKHRELFHDCVNRVQTMSMVHERLYQSGDLALIDFGDQARELAQMLETTYGPRAGSIEVRVNVEAVPVTLDVAIPLGLILNELVSNSFKYAFPDGQSGCIEIGLELTRENCLELSVRDDGVGLPAGLELEKVESLGLRIVQILTKQVDGRLQIRGDKGTFVSVSVPNEPLQHVSRSGPNLNDDD